MSTQAQGTVGDSDGPAFQELNRQNETLKHLIQMLGIILFTLII